MTGEAKRYAPAARDKLNAAIDLLTSLDADVGQLRLDAGEHKSGAAAKLSSHREKIATVQRDVTELTAALSLAERLDRQATAAEAVQLRQAQFSVLEATSAKRVDAVADMMTGIAMVSSSFHKYVLATREYVGAIPSGSRMPILGLGPNGEVGNFLGDMAILLSQESYRVADGAVLPFATAPSLARGTERSTMRPGLDLFLEASNFALSEIRRQVQRLDEEAMAAAGATVEKAA